MTVEAFPVSPGVMLDIDAARELVAKRKPNARLNVSEAALILRRGHASVNLRHVKYGKLKAEPVIMARVAGMRVLVDGWHRAAQAHRKRRKFLAAHLLSERDLRSIAWSLRYFRLAKKKR